MAAAVASYPLAHPTERDCRRLKIPKCSWIGMGEGELSRSCRMPMVPASSTGADWPCCLHTATFCICKKNTPDLRVCATSLRFDSACLVGALNLPSFLAFFLRISFLSLIPAIHARLLVPDTYHSAIRLPMNYI